MKMAKTFKVRSHVVYPGHGVAEIVAIEEKKIDKNIEKYYVLELVENRTRIMVPVKNAEKVGLRNIISNAQVKKIIKILKSSPEEGDPNWNRRHTEYLDKIKTGSIEKACEVYRDLMFAKNEKELSFGEKKILDTTRKLLVTEISFAKKIDENKAEEMLSEIFSGK
ncbi:MAG: CarD family transcriptional regulator [Candidatus Schekmanbacteria bacterium]|nr:MAG: CarD family transcriptional regulator [Candidatus Schekmanbacteria bacterium]